MWLVLWIAVAGATGWQCGVTPEWEREYAAQYNTTRRLASTAAFSRSSTLGPFRIHVEYGDLSYLSASAVTHIQTVIMPSVLAWYANTLSVYNLNQNFILPQTTCGGQPVSSTLQTTGLPNVDYVLFVYAQPSSSGFNAQGGACAFDGGSRGNPVAGTLMYNSNAYPGSSDTSTDIALNRHEIAHGLAISSNLFTSYRQPDGTLYTNPIQTATARGKTVNQLTTPKVLAKTRAAFSCSSLTGLEIEDGGGSGTVGAHWEKRVMFSDFMVGSLMLAVVYTDITLAAFEDSGWYTVNYDYTDQVVFGKGEGCNFINSQCTVSGLPQFPDFCASVNSQLCSNFNTMKGYCTGGDQLEEYCPYPVGYSNGDCTGRYGTAVSVASYYGEKACANCRCLTGTHLDSAYVADGSTHMACHQVTCANGVARVLVGANTVQCPAAGGVVSNIPGFTGYLNCPTYDQLCGRILCYNACYGYGKCVNGQCVCNDGYSGADCSTLCAVTCKTCSGTGATQCLSCYSNASLGSNNSCTCSQGYALSATNRCVSTGVTCDPTCLTCSGTASNQCLTCTSNATKTSGSCVCNSGFVRSVDQTLCQACHATCLTCSGTSSSQCLTCVPNATNASSVCQCNSGFVRSSDQTLCVACDPTCLTCSGTASTQCQTCPSNATKTSGACPCNSGFVRSVDQTQCLACDATCVTCSGTASTQCLTCPSNATKTSGSCVCNAGFVRSVDQTLCQACDPTCTTCTGTANNQCLTCPSNATKTSGACPCNSGYVRNSTQSLCIACDPTCATCLGTASNQCQTCPSNATKTSGACACNSGYVRSSDQKQCVACDPSCATCSGTASSQCVTCPANATVTSGSCPCNSGFVRSTDQTQCLACDPSCATCSGASSSQCLTCPANATNTSGACVCNSGFVRSSDQTRCVACDTSCATCSGTANTQCVTCPANATKTSGACLCNSGFARSSDQTQCVACDATCLTCSGSASTLCVTCPSHATKSSGACVCDAGYTRSSDNTQCLACQTSCSSCQGTAANNCTACKAHASLPSGISVGVCTCDPGYYKLADASCAACDISCKSCTGSAATQCTSCYSGMPDGSGQCQCGPGQYRSQAGSCGLCSANCSSCQTTASTCTSCDLSVASLSGTVCQCLSSAFLNSATSVCMPCHASCASCSAGTPNSCLSCNSNATKSATNSCDCNSAYYMATAFQCASCSPLCLNCTGPSANQCVTCRPASASVVNGTCVCSGSLYLSANTCLPCDQTCLSCGGAGANSCLSCYSHGVLTPVSGPGVCSCASGQYFAASTGCVNCHSSCKECTGSAASQCSVCYPGVTLSGNTCACAAGYLLSQTTSTCIQCSANCKQCIGTPSNCTSCDSTVSVLSTNVCTCIASAFLAQSGACVSCHSSCRSCSGATSTSCLSCFPLASLTAGACQCAAGAFPNPSVTTCSQCDGSCAACNGAGPQACTQCLSPATLTNGCTCPSGYFNPAHCQLCDSSCKTCSAATSNDCQSCYAQAALTGPAPSACQCVNGTVPKPTVATCGSTSCDVTCSTCAAQGANQCLSCYDGATGAFPGACVCKAGFYPNPNSANCGTCHSSCLTCSGASLFQCVSCPASKVLIEGLYCGSSCPSSQTIANSVCQVSTSPLLFRLKLNTSNLPLNDTVAQAIVQPSLTSAPPAYYQQGWLFDGSSYYLRLPPTPSEPARNVVLAATHSAELWVRPTSTGCLLSKYSVANQSISLQVRLCLTQTAQLLLEFSATSLSDASTVIKSLTGGQVSTSRGWTSVGYQLVFKGKTTTVASLLIGQQAVNSATYEGVIYKDLVGTADTVQLLVGAALSSFQTYVSFYKGSIAEVSLYNSPLPVGVGTCSCSSCTSGSLCLSLCLANQYFSSGSCSACQAACTNGCIRATDCRTNVDPLCAVFTSFEGCSACGDLAEMTTTGCKCTANASVVSSDAGSCACGKGYQRSGSKCVQCFAYFAPEQVSARFDSSFLSLIVSFSKPVDTSAVPTCDTIFLPTALNKLGIGYDCAWSRNNKLLNVQLGTNSTLTNEPLALNYVKLYSSQGDCSYAALPLLPVAVYPAPLPAVTIKLVTPKTYSVACSADTALSLDASGTQGGKGRNMTFAWLITSNPLVPTLAQYTNYQTTNPVLRIPNALLSTTVLTIGLTATNFLGTSSATSAQTSVSAGAALSLQIDGGSHIATTAAVKTQVKVSPTALCTSTRYLDYVWAFLQAVPAESGAGFTFLDSPSPPNKLTIPAKTLQPGSSYTFQVSATDGINIGNLTFTIDVLRSPLVAVLDHTDTDISANKTFTLSGKKSYDPDNSPGSLVHAWSCLEGSNVCVDPSGNSVSGSDSVLTLKPSQLKAGVTWNLTLSVSKDTRSASKSVLVYIKATANTDLTLPSDLPSRVNPQRPLQLIFTAATDQSTSFQWTQTYGNTLPLLTPLTYPYLVIAANSMQSGYTYGFALTASSLGGSTTAQIYVTANYAPSGGTATLSPTAGTALKTLFQEVSTGWEDVEQDYPLTYQVTCLTGSREVPLAKRLLSNSLLIKGGSGTYSLIAYVYDALGTYTAVALPVITISAPQRVLQSSSILEAFLQDTVDSEQTYAMVRAYATTYQFDNATYSGVFSALQSYLNQLTELDDMDVDACIASVEALFLQTAQMNANSLSNLLSLLRNALAKYQDGLTDVQRADLVAVLGEYPGTSDEERSLIQAYLKTIMSDSTATALPDQAPSVYVSATSASYARRVSAATLSGMSAASGSTTVVFPSNLTVALGLSSTAVVDVHMDSQVYSNSTSDQVDVSLAVAGEFVSYSFQASANTAQLSAKDLSSPIQLTIHVSHIDPNATYQCVYKDESGHWVPYGMNLTALSSNSATCETNHLSSFQVIQKPASSIPLNPPSGPYSDLPVENSCSTNFAPIAIVSAILLFGLLLSLTFSRLDAKLINPLHTVRPTEEVALSTELPKQGLNSPTERQSLSIGEGKPSVGRLFLETHCLTGLFVHSSKLKRWMKTASWTAVLAGEMAFIGARYEGEDVGGDNHSQGNIWTGYEDTDFLYSLSALGVGLGVALVLSALFTVAGSTGRVVTAVGCTVVGVVLAVALGGTIYMDLDLCFEQGGRWAVSFLPLLLGEVVLCQTIVALFRASVLRVIA